MERGAVRTKRSALLAQCVAATLALACITAAVRAADHATSYAIYKSTDRGRSWVRSDSGLPGDSRINALTAMGSALFAGTDTGIFVSRDAGQTWQEIRGTAASLGRVLSFAFLDGTLFAGTQRSGVFASGDEGKTWKPVNEGLTDRNVRSLLSWWGALYAGTDTEGVFRSADGGRTWTPLSRGIPRGAQVLALAALGESVFAGLYSKGLYRWDEQQKSWVKTGSVLPLVLASVGGTLVAGHNPGGIWWNASLGDTWSAGLAQRARVPSAGAELAPNAPVWMLGSDGRQVFAGAADGIYYSDDAGRTWSRAEAGLPAASPGIAFLVTDDLVLAAVAVSTGASGQP
jgi:photosystem II stability/assembly factor-like uncharacterized protein